MEKDTLQTVQEKAKHWLIEKFDTETRTKVQHLIDHDEKELIECFYKDLEFGTGGLRGLMGVGTNRMNIYTVGMATQGLASYLLSAFSGKNDIKVAIAYDSRNNSKLFAKTAAGILSANGIKVLIYDALRPTPQLSYTIRHFECQSGIVITASHNPKEYNGYKVYWEDGGQIIAPHDKNIIKEVAATTIDMVKFDGPESNITILDDEMDDIYTDKIKSLSLSPESIQRNADIKIVYTPIHGTGVKLVPLSLKKMGFKHILNVPEQDISDGNFPTVHSPNPEEPAALDLALQLAEKEGADLVMGTDPDADRVGIAVRNTEEKLILLNGNQTAALLIYYLLHKWDEAGKLDGKQYIVKTIVTSEILNEIAERYSVSYYDVLTGFKYIADIIKRNAGVKTFIGGGEESYGYLAGEFVRDKDAVMSCALIAEIAAWAKDNGKSLYELLIDIYADFSFYKESLISVVKKGKSGAEEIAEMMENFRSKPPHSINNSDVVLVHDYLKQQTVDMISQKRHPIQLPVSNVLQFVLADGSKISIRPSGTEPKIKFYFSVKTKLENKADFEAANKGLDDQIENIIQSMRLRD